PSDLPLLLGFSGAQAAQFSSDVGEIAPLASQMIGLTYAPRAVGGSIAKLEARACEGCTVVTADLKGRSVPNAFAFSPAPVPFQSAAVHESTQSQTLATNITW